jgi:hypothetical protein
MENERYSQPIFVHGKHGTRGKFIGLLLRQNNNLEIMMLKRLLGVLGVLAVQ